MRHHQYRGAGLINLFQQLHHTAPFAYPDYRSVHRPVTDADYRQCARNCHPLLLTTGEFRRIMFAARNQSDFLQRRLNPFTPLCRTETTIAQGTSTFVRQIQIRNQIKSLKNETQFSFRKRVRCVSFRPCTCAIQQILTGTEIFQQSGNIQEGGFAGTEGPVTVTNSPSFTSISSPRKAWVSTKCVRYTLHNFS
jgi:hypothetical protein